MFKVHSFHSRKVLVPFIPAIAPPTLSFTSLQCSSPLVLEKIERLVKLANPLFKLPGRATFPPQSPLIGERHRSARGFPHFNPTLFFLGDNRPELVIPTQKWCSPSGGLTLSLKIAWMLEKEKVGDMKAVYRIGLYVLCPSHEERIAGLFGEMQCPIWISWSPRSSILTSIVGESPTNEQMSQGHSNNSSGETSSQIYQIN
ncbi:hypothetical protein TNCV_2033321 [Trichonephila clavipes]|nr:hypothetical protein TNCV_2033321 [Trichonephila clavipes]